MYLEIEDKLCKILNRIYIMVRRWANEPYTSCRMSCNRNVTNNLVTRKLTTFTTLGTLLYINYNKRVNVYHIAYKLQVISENYENKSGHRQ
jgi:hypothetical protein